MVGILVLGFILPSLAAETAVPVALPVAAPAVASDSFQPGVTASTEEAEELGDEEEAL